MTIFQHIPGPGGKFELLPDSLHRIPVEFISPQSNITIAYHLSKTSSTLFPPRKKQTLCNWHGLNPGWGTIAPFKPPAHIQTQEECE